MGKGIDSEDFGNGEVGGDAHWESPVWATTDQGEDITISLGREGREVQSLTRTGHTESGTTFYGNKGKPGVGHDHNGIGPRGIRGKMDK